MPVDYYIDSDSDFSETDMSIRGRNARTSFHRRSASRPRRPELERTYLSPVQQATRVYRSASTGGRRPRERESPPAVMIVNEQAQRTSNSRDNKPRRVKQQTVLDNDSDEELLRSPRRRAASGVPRAPSPYHRDYEVLLGQRMLEKNDFRQDMEIWKQKQEIERLEAELEKHRQKYSQKAELPARDGRESRLLREEEEWYEDEISDRLRRLERFERRSRSEVEKKLADQWRLKKFEEAEKEAAGKEEVKAKLQEEKWKEAARQQKEEEEREKLKQEIIAEERQKAMEEEEKKKQEIEMKKAAVEEWKIEQERINQAQKELAEWKDKEFRERLRLDLGYTEEEIEEKLKKKDEKEKGKAKTALEPLETTWIKVNSKHLNPATLQAYNLPWDWDEDTNYIIIKRYITEELQDELFEHSKRLRDNRVLAQTSSSTTELKINDRGKDRLYLVRKKSPRRRSHIFA